MEMKEERARLVRLPQIENRMEKYAYTYASHAQ